MHSWERYGETKICIICGSIRTTSDVKSCNKQIVINNSHHFIQESDKDILHAEVYQWRCSVCNLICKDTKYVAWAYNTCTEEIIRGIIE